MQAGEFKSSPRVATLAEQPARSIHIDYRDQVLPNVQLEVAVWFVDKPRIGAHIALEFRVEGKVTTMVALEVGNSKSHI